MTRVAFTENLRRHVDCPDGVVAGRSTVTAVLEAYFESHPDVRGYVLDDDGSVRHHVVVFLNGQPIADRAGLSDAVDEDDEVLVMQALSGG